MNNTENSKDTKQEKLPKAFIKSFWVVFTLPFRTVWFIYRRLSEIPLKNLLLMTGIFIGLVAITLGLLVKGTSQPGFCVTCHYMKPYFASWETSSHYGVHCTECHFPPGVKGTVMGKFTALAMVANYVTGVYKKSKPWAEISDESCLRSGCHETRLLEGQVSYKEGIIFDHKPHLTEDRRGKNLRCTSCHSQIVQGSHMTVTEETCFLCHFKEQPEEAHMTSCTLCHDAPVENDTAAVIFDHKTIVARETDCRLCHGHMAEGNGDVPKERCSYCHAEEGKLERYAETIQLHQVHISQHKVECNHCHNTVLHQSTARSGNVKPDCQACHIDRHLEQYYLFSGQGADGVDPVPAAMFHAGLGCKACHVILPADWEDHPSLATSSAGPASCDPCHQEDYYSLYQKAKPILQQRISAIQGRVRSLKKRRWAAEGREKLATAEDNLNLIIRGHPIHNLEYSDRILNEINRSLDVLEGKKPASRALPDTTSERCVRCHYGQDETKVDYYDRTFSHRNHVHGQGVDCATCHIEEESSHGKLKKGDYCMDCHHEAAAVSCEPCHVSQRHLIRAKGIFSGFDVDPMYELEMTCRDCHEVAGTIVNRPMAETCEICHEPGYWESLQEFRTDLVAQLLDLEQALQKMPVSPERDRGLSMIQALKADGTDGAHNNAAAQSALLTIQAMVHGEGNVAAGN